MMRCNGVSNYWYKEGKRYVVADIISGDTPLLSLQPEKI